MEPERSALSGQSLIDVRVPMALRIGLFVLGAILDGMAALGAWYLITEAPHDDVIPGFGVVLIFLSFGWFAWRMATARLTLLDDTFQVRNYFRTERVLISDVDRFEIGDNAWGISLIPRTPFER